VVVTVRQETMWEVTPEAWGARGVRHPPTGARTRVLVAVARAAEAQVRARVVALALDLALALAPVLEATLEALEPPLGETWLAPSGC
jgi:hypothetical protein